MAVAAHHDRARWPAGRHRRSHSRHRAMAVRHPADRPARYRPARLCAVAARPGLVGPRAQGQRLERHPAASRLRHQRVVVHRPGLAMRHADHPLPGQWRRQQHLAAHRRVARLSRRTVRPAGNRHRLHRRGSASVLSCLEAPLPAQLAHRGHAQGSDAAARRHRPSGPGGTGAGLRDHRDLSECGRHRGRSRQRRGLGGVLHTLAEQPYGRWLLGVSLGLVAYGLYCFINAGYRRAEPRNRRRLSPSSRRRRQPRWRRRCHAANGCRGGPATRPAHVRPG